MSKQEIHPETVIFEFTCFPHITQVKAFDTQTLTEVCITCPSKLPRESMKATALSKLSYILKKEKDK